MNRRAFLRGLGLAPVAAAVAPSLAGWAETYMIDARAATLPSDFLRGVFDPRGPHGWVDEAGPQIVRLGSRTTITGLPPLKMDYLPLATNGEADQAEYMDRLMQRMAARFD